MIMRKIVVAEFLSLDGVMEEPAWTALYWNDEIAKFKYDELFASGAHLLGRVTYQGFADRMNGLPKYVVSTTLEKAGWNNSHLIKKNVTEEVSKLKQQPGQDILVAGSATLVNTLMEHDLVDEYHLLVYPVVLGSGKRLFKDIAKPVNLKLLEAKSFTTGVVLLSYAPERK
jgi:dihydrofolate reductase